jgi:hypothetical protein
MVGGEGAAGSEVAAARRGRPSCGASPPALASPGPGGPSSESLMASGCCGGAYGARGAKESRGNAAGISDPPRPRPNPGSLLAEEAGFNENRRSKVWVRGPRPFWQLCCGRRRACRAQPRPPQAPRPPRMRQTERITPAGVLISRTNLRRLLRTTGRRKSSRASSGTPTVINQFLAGQAGTPLATHSARQRVPRGLKVEVSILRNWDWIGTWFGGLERRGRRWVKLQNRSGSPQPPPKPTPSPKHNPQIDPPFKNPGRGLTTAHLNS